MRCWIKVTVAAAAVLAGGRVDRRPVDWWLVRTACDGAPPAGAVRQLASPGYHFTQTRTRYHAGLGDYGCTVRYEGDSVKSTLVLEMDAHTRRDDQDSENLSAFPETGFAPVRSMPERLPGFIEKFGALPFLLP
ncbi:MULTISPECIES: hypothetical protein [Streptomyces]|uniref:hypothetical protein n=1 Tax=Streptomyces TaxID=1883 RepID=UPI00292E3E8D|nr:hypothetical protein [Streptomyces sp. NEAU-HV9]